MTILVLPGMIRILAFLTGIRGSPQPLQKNRLSCVGILTFVRIEIFRASST